MAKSNLPVTHAVRALRQAKVEFKHRPYRYVAAGGTTVSAAELGVDEHCVIKTLIMEDENRQPLIVLMHGDCEVSTKSLARQIGVKAIQPCQPQVADRHSGYQVGGTSPFGTRKTMPVYCEKSILDLPTIYINGGKRGLLVAIDPREMEKVVRIIPVSAIQ
jgi:Cys-tRNA(Pro) deacylase